MTTTHARRPFGWFHGLALTIAVLAAEPVRAQGQVAIHPTGTYSVASAGETIHLFRLSPGFTAGYESPRGEVIAAYIFDAERYPGHGDLNALRGRERALFRGRYAATPHLGFALDAGYDAYTRVDARRVSAHPSLRIQVRPRTLLYGGGHFADESLSEMSTGRESRIWGGRVGVERQVTPRQVTSLEYEGTTYLFDGRDRTASHVARLGWTYAATPATRFTVQAGPRITDGAISPDVTLVLTRDLRRGGDILVGYSHTETTLVGLPGIVQADSLHARVRYSLSRALTLLVAPMAFNGVRGDRTSRVYGITVGGSYDFSRSVALDVTYGIDRQRGTLDLIPMPASDYRRGILTVMFTKAWGGSGERIRPPVDSPH